MFIGRTDAEAEVPMLWPPDVKSWLTGKDLDARKDWRQEEKGATEDKTVGWHHRLKGHEFEQMPGDRRGQRSLACCSPWGCKELDTSEVLSNRSFQGVSTLPRVYLSVYSQTSGLYPLFFWILPSWTYSVLFQFSVSDLGFLCLEDFSQLAEILQVWRSPFSRGSSQSRDQTQVSYIAGRLFISWATREAQEYWRG